MESVSYTHLDVYKRQDGVRCVLPMFKDGGWEYDGPYFKFPLRNVLPKRCV